jgi:hypothetical protein
LIAGPDISAIKLQSVYKVGLNAGLIVGYKLNNRWSIESGLLRDKKFYSSEGQYFSTKKIRLPNYAKIDYVKGECNMWELPLNITYNFARKSNSSWFAAAGFSSYFMKKEAYVFDMSYNGTQYPRAFDYKNPSTQFLAVINISAGYTHKLGKIADLRIEPYLKLPVNKIGTGDLPIQSGGILIGLTRGLF